MKHIHVYDPSTGVWTVTASMNYYRSGHKASVLTNGEVLVTGGYSGGNFYLNSAELYQP
jgi:N-acetylneuraminic acid mutarotase